MEPSRRAHKVAQAAGLVAGFVVTWVAVTRVKDATARNLLLLVGVGTIVVDGWFLGRDLE